MAVDSTVEVAGTGDPVILVHGLGGTGNVWVPQVGILSRFFTTVRQDLAGSGRAKTHGPVTTQTLVEDILATMSELKIEAAHFVGHSYGTVLCQHLAAKHPGKVRSLSLFGPIRAPADPARQALKDRAAKARAEGLTAIADITVQMGTSASTKAHRPEVAGFIRELVMRQDPEGYAQTCEAVAGTQAADLSGLRCPAVVVTGDEDATSPPAVAKTVADALAGSKFHVLGRCGHWTPLERAEAVSEAVFNLLYARAS